MDAMTRPPTSELIGRERVARGDRPARVAPAEPAHPLFGRAVRPRVGAHGAGGLALQPVVTHGGRGADRRLDVARLEQVALLRRVGPDSGEAVGLELEADRR